MENFLTPSVLGLLLLVLLTLVGVGVIALYLKVIKPRIEASAYWKQYQVALEGFGNYVQDVVLRIAFSPDILDQYRYEAEQTGRDVRLVAALHLLDNWTTERGIELDEEELVTAIEANLHRLKVIGFIPWAEGEEQPEAEPLESEGGGEAGDLPSAQAPAITVNEPVLQYSINGPGAPEHLGQVVGESNEDYALRAARLRGDSR